MPDRPCRSPHAAGPVPCPGQFRTADGLAVTLLQLGAVAVARGADIVEELLLTGAYRECLPVVDELVAGAVRDLETSPVGQAYVVARANFEKLMARVNQQISEGMEKGATSSIITLG